LPTVFVILRGINRTTLMARMTPFLLHPSEEARNLGAKIARARNVPRSSGSSLGCNTYQLKLVKYKVYQERRGVIEKWLYVKGKDTVIYDPSSDPCFHLRRIHRVYRPPQGMTEPSSQKTCRPSTAALPSIILHNSCIPRG